MTTKHLRDRHGRTASALAVAVVLMAGASPAMAQAGKSLGNCEKTVAAKSGDYVRALTASVSSCLKKISMEVIRNGSSTAAAATAVAPDCEEALRAIVNSDAPAEALERVFVDAIDEDCDAVAHPGLEHTDADVVTMAGATGLGSFCRSFGGDGSVDSYAEWRDCMRLAAECQARQAIAVEWPRALEYFEALAPAFAALPGSSARTDAEAALSALDSALEGRDDDNRPDLVCGFVDTTVLASGFTVCRQGYVYSEAPGPCPDAPYQQDGNFNAGEPRQYEDSGSGTVRDLVTGLEWEKLGDDGSIHDQDDTYTWYGAFTQKIAALNANGGFAGHTDWRLPNRRELESLVLPSAVAPAIDAAFHEDCQSSCNGLGCACTASLEYWTSTSYQRTPSQAWQIGFHSGIVSPADKSSLRRVRAVREGR